MSADTEPQEAQDVKVQLRPQVPSSTFDFTQGAFERARNTRMLNVVLAAIVALLALALVGLGVRDTILASGSEGQLDSSSSDLSKARQQLDQAISSATGSSPSSPLTASAMEDRIGARASGLAAAAENDFDAAAAWDSASAAATSSGARLTVLRAEPTSAPLGDDPTSATPAPVDGGGLVVTLEAETANPDAGAAWQEAVRALGWLGPEPTFDFRAGTPNVLVASGTVNTLSAPGLRSAADAARGAGD